MSYCFIFSNIYLKIFFMIKVYGCEKKNEEKKPPKMERLLLERILQSQANQYQLSFFFYSKNIFVFLNESLILINIFSNLYFHHYYMTKKIFV